MKDFINNNLYNLLGITTGVIGVILAIVFYIKSKKIKKPFYSLSSFCLVNERFADNPDIKIKFKDESIETLTVTKVAIWNGGRDTINKSDIPLNTGIKVHTTNGITIYCADIIYNSDTANNFSLIHDNSKNEIIIDFDYFDYDQGVIIKIFHSGTSSKNINLTGKVKGVGCFVEIPDPKMHNSPIDRDAHKFNFILYLFMSIMFILGTIFMKTIGAKILSGFFGFVFAISIVIDIILPRFPKSIYNQLR
jgi:hypothetical protein